MKKNVVLGTLLLISINVWAGEKAHWGYSGNTGPKNWAQLTSENASCDGKNQSPINLTGFVEATTKPIKFNYQPKAGDEILNNGHTVQVNYQQGSSISVDGQKFALKQFHFHAPSENHINGHSFPLEMHLVHADDNGNLAVVAVMFEQGSANNELSNAWNNMPKHNGNKNTLTPALSVKNLLPNNRDYYRFNGSLTTPPCSEGVRWLVMKDAMSASAQQISAFKAVLHEPNNRPIQAINARTILQ
ncbi:MAG: carbonic anhydrase [Gammaproteobacteria bacterium]|nr:MAG: carbonic anhydrase [Gammaproteobacteria bacterium]